MDAVTDESARAMVAEAGATSFERAYVDCRLPVYRYLRSIAGSDDTAAELTAVAFERAFASFERFEASRPILPWLLRIARNVAIDRARRDRPTLRLEELPAAEVPALVLRIGDELTADDVGGDVADQVRADAFDHQDGVLEVGKEAGLHRDAAGKRQA
jgi:DNA-directed RNA polymerase specialized sigma subunit, sigma24 homolog